MTERLTDINEFGNADIIGVDALKLLGNLKPMELLQVSNVLEKLAHYEDLEEQLENLYGGKMPLDKVVENLNRIVQNGEEKLDYARILTNTEAEKWDRWLDLEEAGRLIELPCDVGDTVWIIAPNYYKCNNRYKCEDYNPEEYLISWCHKNCSKGYQGIGTIQCIIYAIETYNDENSVQIDCLLDVNGNHYRYSIKDIFLTKEEAEAKLKERCEQE